MKFKNWLHSKYCYIYNKINYMAKYLKDLLEHATTQGYKSNVIKPLSGMMIIFLIGTVVLSYFNVAYFPIVLGVLTTICGIGMLFAYFFCLFKNPDLLRSEKYNLEKTAIEKVSITGDSSTRASILMPRSDYIIEGQQGVHETIGGGDE